MGLRLIAALLFMLGLIDFAAGLYYRLNQTAHGAHPFLSGAFYAGAAVVLWLASGLVGGLVARGYDNQP